MAGKKIKIDGAAKKIGLCAAALLCLTAAAFAVRWCAANAIASHTIYRDVADYTVSLAPDDPQTHYTIAVLSEKSFTSEDLPKSVEEYDHAAALAPNDFRTWLALGKVKERAGDRAGAEVALARAQQLAPNYSEVSWIFGNVLLRAGKRQQAFEQMRRAAETDNDYTNPTIGIAWQIFGGDLAEIKQALGDSPAINAAFVALLAREKRFDDALKIWNALPVESRRTIFKEDGKVLFEQMLNAGKYRDAVRAITQTDESASFAPGRIFNGDFEADIKGAGASVFDWQIADGTQPVIGVDDVQKHGGSHSLTIVFNSPTGRDFRVVLQTVALEAGGGKYAFEAFYKSELKTIATAYWEIFDVTNGKVLAQTPPANAVAPNWTDLKTEFVAPPNAEAVAVRLVRETCKSALCPISGRVWFDDLSLSKIQN